MICKSIFPSLVILLIFTMACNRPAPEAQVKSTETYLVSTNAVGFQISPLPSENGYNRWFATYAAGGKTAKFIIELAQEQTQDDTDKQFVIKFGKGRFVTQPGSDASVLLADLKKALEAKKLPSRVPRSATLPFTFANIGENMSQSGDGGFSVKPAGNWTAIKLFLGEGEKEEDVGEVFLNLNPTIRMGEFSIKDPDYGDLVVAQLAKVL
jgi:hypothetical protein